MPTTGVDALLEKLAEQTHYLHDPSDRNDPDGPMMLGIDLYSFSDELEKISSLASYLPASKFPGAMSGVPRVAGRGFSDLINNIKNKISPRAPALASKLMGSVESMKRVHPTPGQLNIRFEPGTSDPGIYKRNLLFNPSSVANQTYDPAVSAHEMGHALDDSLGKIDWSGSNRGILKSEMSANRHAYSANPTSPAPGVSAAGYWEHLHRPTTVKVLGKHIGQAAKKLYPEEVGKLTSAMKRFSPKREEILMKSEYSPIFEPSDSGKDHIMSLREKTLHQKAEEAQDIINRLGPKANPRFHKVVRDSNMVKMINHQEELNSNKLLNLANPVNNPQILDHLSPKARRVMDKLRAQGVKAVNKGVGQGAGNMAYSYIDSQMGPR